jgi:hypothetical protein
MRLLALLLAVESSFVYGRTHPCAGLPDARERLACYDREFPRSEAVPRSAPAVMDEAELQAHFGLSGREIEMRRPETQRAQEFDRVEARVVSVRPLRGGQREVVLGNGQTWRVTEGGSRGPLNEGDTVSIRRTFAGGYLLSKPGGAGLRVRRLR